MQKGNIGITTENIFPVIKKFLYSDHEIFLREIVANAVDATQKLRTLAMRGEVSGELGDLSVRITLDPEQGTLTVSDRGIGMTAEEIDKYINQIAFSGAGEFLEKYKDDANAIIGHFGLGFYSTFMVAKQVEILTRSYRDGAQAVRWSCDGTPAYEITEAERDERGTDIILHIDDDCREFLERGRIEGLLRKYCRFLPVPVVMGKKTEWKDGKQVETDEDNVVNETRPLWTRTPSELKDEDYLQFYRDLYPMQDEPLFWIHLNVDFPFTLTGILYFPRIKQNIDIHRNKIQLYCNQVFVTDQVDNIVPDFLTLLHGVIDSPDIPLNVSRSYLQSDANVKKISGYITKKVADRLQSIFKTQRDEFERKWDDLKLFIHYGMLSEPDFYDRAKDFALLRDVDGKAFTYEEYRTLIKDSQTDKDGNLVYLYASDREEQWAYVEAARAKGYSVLLMDGQLDTPLVQMLETKFEKSRFSRVDGDTPERLIRKDDGLKSSLSEAQTENLCAVFKAAMPTMEKAEFTVSTEAMGEAAAPLIITQSEYMRRMKEAARLQPGMAFYGEMPDMYNLVLNADHRLLKRIVEEASAALDEPLRPVEAELRGLEARRAALEAAVKDKKPEDITEEQRTERQQTQDAIAAQQQKRDELRKGFARDNALVSQLVDLALLQNGLLRGEALARFLRRSVELL
ncbi:MAG: molecular chaperone HtpG [Alloprevotella sp.]|nr:molecular chaperone HtpG [Alloprevotella sp.]